MPAPKSIYRAALDARASRRAAAGVPRRWDVTAVAGRLRDQVREAEDAGLLDPRLLDDYQSDLEALIERAMSGGVGRGWSQGRPHGRRERLRRP